MFNSYFTNIGPELSKDITVSTNPSIYDYLKTEIINTFFSLKLVRRTLSELLNTWECKTSTDYKDISMLLVRKVTKCITNVSRIFVIYLSLLKCSRKKIKIAKVIPLFKSGDKYISANYWLLLPQFSNILVKRSYLNSGQYLPKSEH